MNSKQLRQITKGMSDEQNMQVYAHYTFLESTKDIEQARPVFFVNFGVSVSQKKKSLLKRLQEVVV